jgi:endonuclease YncB( thermonuclease family)
MAGVSGIIVCAVLSVYDGDTIKVVCNPWPDMTIQTSVRLDGIDTPELRGKCRLEKELAILARERTRNLIGKEVELRNVRNGKFAGRVIADVFSDGNNLAQILITEGHGREYDGGKREGWCGDVE